MKGIPESECCDRRQRYGCNNSHDRVPMLFEKEEDYQRLEMGDILHIDNFPEQIRSREVTVTDKTQGFDFKVKLELTDSEMEVVLAGGQLRFLKDQLRAEGVLTD